MPSRRRPGAFLAIGLAVALMVPALALADATDADGDGVPDDLEDASQRVVLVDLYPDLDPVALHVKSSSAGATPNDILDLEYEGGRLFASYYANASEELPSLSYRLRPRELLELRGTEVVRTVPLEDLLRSAPMRVDVVNTTDGERDRVFHLGPEGGTFGMTLHVVDRFARIGGELVTPMEVKVDFHVRNFTVPPGSEIALRVDLESGHDAALEETSYDEDLEYATGEREMNVTAGPHAMFFSWSINATVDGQTRAVRATTEYVNESHEILFVYGGGSAVDHDPKVGIASAAFLSIRSGVLNPPVLPVPQGNLLLFLASVAAITAIVAVTALWRRRRFRE